MALIAEDALISAVIDTRTLDWELNWVYQVHADTITTDNEQALTDALNVLRATRGSIDVLTALLTRGPGPQSGGDGIDIRNELPQVFERFNADARTASAAIVLGATGIVALALTALVMLAALIADRRRELMVLLRSRGAASRQLLAALLVESLLICVPAATAGYVLTRALIDTPALRSAQIAAALTCGAAILVWLLAARVTLFGQLGRLLGAQVALPSRRRLWRAAAEGAVVVLAITALWLIRRRGLEPSGAPDALLAVDPLLAAVPALLGLVFGLAALRLYPWAARVIGRLTHFSRGALAFVSARRIAGQSTAAALPLVVMIVAIGLSVFASVLVSSVQVTRADYVWHEVRADYRIDAAGTTSFALPARLDMSAVPGVEVHARELRTTANAERGGSNGGNVVQSRSLAFLALDIAQFAAVTDGTPVAAAFPTALTTGTPLGTIEQPLPAVISEAWPEGAGPRPGLGDTFELAVIASQFGAPLDIVVQVVEVRPDAPGTSGPFALVDWEAFAAVSAADTGRELRPSSIYLRGAPDETVLRQTIIEQALIFEAPEAGQTALPLGIRLVSRTARLSALSDAPLARGLVDSFQLAVLCAALYSVVAMGAGMILTARARRRDLSYLRTLGMSSRQAFALVLLEQAPAALVASVFGVALGILTARLIAPGIDLAAFIGPDIPVAMTDDWGAIIAIVLLLGLGVFLATVITSIFARRTQLSDVLRIGDR